LDHPEDGSNKLLQNIGHQLSNYQSTQHHTPQDFNRWSEISGQTYPEALTLQTLTMKNDISKLHPACQPQKRERDDEDDDDDDDDDDHHHHHHDNNHDDHNSKLEQFQNHSENM
jgi:hypothetical protein